jgi:hypothetical protein
MVGRLLGSIGTEADKTLERHRRNNPALIQYRRSAGALYVDRFLFARSIFFYMLVYVVMIVGLLGGCAVMASDLDRVIRNPWKEVRRIITGMPLLPISRGYRQHCFPGGSCT